MSRSSTVRPRRNEAVADDESTERASEESTPAPPRAEPAALDPPAGRPRGRARRRGEVALRWAVPARLTLAEAAEALRIAQELARGLAVSLGEGWKPSSA